MHAPMFYGPGQQPGFIPPGANGRGGVSFPPQPGMGMPGAQAGGRPGQFPPGYPQQSGRGGPNSQQIQPNMYGLPGQLPPGAIPQSAYGGPGNPAYAAAMAQAQAAALAGAGRAGPSGRAPIPGMPGITPNIGGLQGVRGGPGIQS